MAEDLMAAAMADMKSALADAGAAPQPRKPRRRPTKENIISVQNLLSGTDGFGIKIKIFTAEQQRQRAQMCGVSEYKYEGGTIPSDEEGLRLPGKFRHGHGEMSDEVGNRYVGEWVNDKRSGTGTYTFASGDVYEGQWLDGMYHGFGTYSSAESDEYEGEWRQDKMSGRGKYRYRELGDVYEGDWAGGLREGVGKYTCADGTVFVGQYEAGELVKKIKIGANNFKAGTDALGNRLMFFSATQACLRAREAELTNFVYEGDTLASDQEGLKTPGLMRHGHGEQQHRRRPGRGIIPTRACAVCSLAALHRATATSVAGEIRYETGASYTGQWQHDKRSDLGTFTFACGDVYEGEWGQNGYHGHGKYSSAETDEYEGQWRDDKMHGQGRYLFRATGDVHEGGYVDGVREGKGTYTKADGTMKEGEWKAGELVE